MYDELNFERAPSVRATVVRGHIMRYDARESWPAILVALPEGTVAQDADAIPHYKRGADRRYYEYYGWEPSTACSPLYVLKSLVQPVPCLSDDALVYQACWLAMQHAAGRYLMTNAHGRLDGAEKAMLHIEMCAFYVALVRGVELDSVRRLHEDDFQLVHDHTQQLTDYLDEVIGFPLNSRPDYDDLTPKFFAKFHELALEALAA